MGSLPNLNELDIDKARKNTAGRLNEMALERLKDFDKDREIFSGHQIRHDHHHHQQRHSLTTRKILRTRSSGDSHQIWDDRMIEQLAAHSPTLNYRLAGFALHQPGQSYSLRRRDSINSSIGANSIRRLLTIKRMCHHRLPLDVRNKLFKNFILLSLAHGLVSAVIIPLVCLQASNSTWLFEESWLHGGPHIGSLLFSLCFFISAVLSICTNRIVDKFGSIPLIAATYTVLCLFLAAHIYPSFYILLPAYILFGLFLGPSIITKYDLVVLFATKLSCGHDNCVSNTAGTQDDLDDINSTIDCSRNERVRRLARWFIAAQDLGLTLGAVIASIMLTCAANSQICLYANESVTLLEHKNLSTKSFYNPNDTTIQLQLIDQLKEISLRNKQMNGDERQRQISLMEHIEEFLVTNIYYKDDQGERICGADTCPTWDSIDLNGIYNITNFDGSVVNSTVKSGSLQLIIIYMMLSMIASMIAWTSNRMEHMPASIWEPIKGMKNTLLFAGPMAYFIGTEQGYMLGDFTKAYVSCTLGPQMVAGSLVGYGLMQMIVSCTLSMLLRHAKRIAVLAAGFFFHACLLLVLSKWKPSKDDSALFYVITASWGACNAMWETLTFALVTLTHTNHIRRIMSVLQASRFMGLAITLALSSFICEKTKIMLLALLLVICVPPYGLLEIRMEARRKQNHLNSR